MALKDHPILNFSNPLHLKLAMEFVKSRKGKGYHVFDVHALRDARTLSQNAYMHGVLFAAAAKGLSEAWGREVTMHEAKDFLKDRFLRTSVADANGEVRGSRTVGTSELDIAQCSWFIERVIEFCADELNIDRDTLEAERPQA